MSGKYTLLILLAALLAAGSWSCRRGEGSAAQAAPDDVLYVYNDSSLRLSDVVRRIPKGLSPEDSTLMFESLVRSWLEQQLFSDLAAANLTNADEINRLTEQYRKRLIIEEYKKKMRLSHEGKKSAGNARVHEYYEAHKEDFRLSEPVVKGIYIKIPTDANQLGEVRSWVFNASRQSVDRIEKYGLRGAIQYEYFADRWIDWGTIADQIPYSFPDPDQFVSTTRNFETSDNESTYLLHIYSYIRSGEVMPEEYASPFIVDMLSRQSSLEYENKLFDNLLRQALKEGKLVKGEMVK